MDSEDFLIERLILRIGNNINNVRIADLKEADLTPAQSETILFYDKHPGANIRDLSEYLKITHQAARKLVDKLKTKGIVQAAVSDKDRRNANVCLTENGREVCEELKKSGTSAGEDLLIGFSPEEKQTLLLLMQRVEKNIRRKKE